jgi:hypothetical protein
MLSFLQAMATAFAERKVLLKQRQAELNAQARFLAGEAYGTCEAARCCQTLLLYM